ncbi:hypothetical protein B0H34DRAFT_298567 [Crassisporium funariophilum]|nr:hypothetical protein B0H34DRAFT_298567 [Crassisporium funariophilum]
MSECVRSTLSGTMQVAPSPYPSSLSHAPYHGIYHLHPPGPQDHELKRKYLALLPPQQIIEICLTFDIHVPPYVKSTIWPPDINAAIVGLQNSPAPASSDNVAENTSKGDKDVMDSLKSPPPQVEPSPTPQDNVPPTEPRPPDTNPSPVAVSSSVATASTTAESTSLSTEPANANPSAVIGPPQQAQPALVQPGQPAPHAQPAFPHQPYGYGHPQAHYPHTPYYPPHAGYPYTHTPYPSYPLHMQNGYPSHVPPSYPTQTSAYNNLIPQPQIQEGTVGDDLPSYEEMIVEALTETTDPEGCAPKDLFTKMASRYPLQSNFRPSASQALQKAFKRGRFEKSSNGKYRLNATWEGGNTSRRTTRRPQTQNSSSGGGAAPASPFTHAPLVHHHHTPTPTQTPAHQSYQPQPYGYPYPHMGYGYPPQAQPSTSAPAVTAAAATDTSKAALDSDGDSADAYEAAKAILNAINGGNLIQFPPDDFSATATDHDDQSSHHQSISHGVEQLLSHLQTTLASSAAASASGSGTVPIPAAPAPATNPDAPTDPRAELQAQLALLAAQLAELAQTEDGPDVQDLPAPMSIPISRPAPIPAPAPAPEPAPPVSVAVLPPVAVPETELDDESDDDDMEEII